MRELPVTVRRAIEIAGLFFLGSILVLGHNVISPLLMAVYIAIVLLPIYRFCRRRKFPEALAIGTAILMVFILVGLIIWFFSSQVSSLIADFPRIKANVMLHLTTLSEWINAKTNFSTERQLQILNEQSNNVLNNAGNMIGGAAASLSSILIFVGLLPIYIFLILYYRKIITRFIFLWFPKEDYDRVQEGIHKTESIIKSYLVGLLIQITYITVLLGGALLLFGIKHALLIGVIFAILNLIPYIGALFGNIIGVLLTLTASQELGPIFTVLSRVCCLCQPKIVF